MTDVDQPPHKKRRFFVDDPPEKSSSAAPSIVQDVFPTRQPPPTEEESPAVVLLRAVVGNDLPPNAIAELLASHGNDAERAINAYYDGSWRNASAKSQTSSGALPSHTPKPSRSSPIDTVMSDEQVRSPSQPVLSRRRSVPIDLIPARRYIGSIGVTGWATKSGIGLLQSGEAVKIERQKPTTIHKIGRGGKSKAQIRRTQDFIVRFTNSKGVEIGRLEKESAIWISALHDQQVCHFDGRCIFAPDRLRTNETVYLQLRCSLRKQAFQSSNFVKPVDNNRQTGLFEEKESEDERDLRMRQAALVKLFSEVNLLPIRANEMTVKHKREGLLQATDVAEQYAEPDNKDAPSSNGDKPAASDDDEEKEEGEELEQDQLDTLYKKAQSFDFNTPEAQPSDTFVMNLRKYQKQALHWMLSKEEHAQQSHKEQSMHPLWEEYCWPTKDADDQELPSVDDQGFFYANPYSGELSLDFPVQEQNCLGGILADEMGLGKTIEMLSLVHSHVSPEQKAAMAENRTETVVNLPRLANNSSTVERAPATTLVIAPMSLLAQWASEAEKASKAGTMKVLVYYGTEKNTNLQTLCRAANAMTAPNIIITSYGVVLSEYNSVAAMGGNRGSHGGLFSIEYWRVILDEAHTIKNRQSKTARACYELAAKHRWVLTGTPIVNRLEDLFSLVRFLKVEPWNNFSFWKTFITVPFEKGDFVRALDVVQTVLEPLVLRRTKHMKTPDGDPLVPLPSRTIQIEKVELSEPEREIYGHVFARARRTFSANVAAGTLMKSYTAIFAQILRLRQSCCHPILTRSKNLVAEEDEAAAALDVANGLADDMDLSTLLERFEADDDDQDASRFGSHVLKQIQDEADMECPICSEEPMEEQAVTGCWHSACRKCLLDYIEHQTSKGELPRCFNCREPINSRDVFEVIRHDVDDLAAGGIVLSENRDPPTSKPTPRISLRRVNQLSSAKIGALTAKLKQLRKDNPLTKSVVFSQFTSFLDILGPALQSSNIHCLRFDGSMSQKERTKVLGEFADASKFTVLLLSLRAGGVGLNLTCANKCFMMDPWWSYAIEAQAIDRVHRMGQTQPVEVIRYIVANSIEEKMLRVQDRKKFIASSLGMMSDEEKKLQRIEDIRELLSE